MPGPTHGFASNHDVIGVVGEGATREVLPGVLFYYLSSRIDERRDKCILIAVIYAQMSLRGGKA